MRRGWRLPWASSSILSSGISSPRAWPYGRRRGLRKEDGTLFRERPTKADPRDSHRTLRHQALELAHPPDPFPGADRHRALPENPGRKDGRRSQGPLLPLSLCCRAGLCSGGRDRNSHKTPETISELIRLPGVGRKTACCVMVYGFGKPALPVDTHVHRISNRLGLIRTRSPGESERALMALVPEEYLMNYNELMVKHGQSICKPIGPRCHSCPVVRLCEFGSRQEPGRRRANPQ
jgi:hypothetical protein